ncbi:MAG: hypothetical protein ACE5PT_08495 [Gemmatimonadales bacterium]
MKRHVTLILLALAVVPRVGAQEDTTAREEVGPPRGSVGWRIRRAPAVDLWYHGMAAAGLDDPEAPLPLYSADYAARMRDIKQDLGVRTALDSLGKELAAEFSEADMPELFHFLPLYFQGVEVASLLDALTLVAQRRTRDSTLQRRGLRFGVAVVARGTQRKEERRLLEKFVGALRDEWLLFYQGYLESRSGEDSTFVAGVQALWDSVLGPGLEPFLSSAGLRGGTIYVSPAVGPEGRLVLGDMAEGVGHVVAVGVPAEASNPDVVAFAALKELCFAFLDEAVARGSEFEDERAHAAVRCGALLLEFYAPILTARYRRAFLTLGGSPEARSVGAFESMYPLTPEVYEALRRAIRRRR